MTTFCVKLAEPWLAEDCDEVAASTGGSVVGAAIPQIRAFRVSVETTDADAVLSSLRSHPRVERATLQSEVSLQPHTSYYSSQDDPLLYHQWHLIRHGIPQAWRYTTGDPSIKACVVDSGLYRKTTMEWHPDLPTMPAGAKWNAHLNNTDVGEDIEGYWVDLYGPNEHSVFSIHGIEVLGIIIAKRNNASGGAGVAPGLTPMFGRVTYLTGRQFPNNGAWGVYEAAQCVTHFTDLGAKIFNLSFGAPWDYDPPDRDLLGDAITYAWNAGSIVVAAAGNEGQNIDTQPVAPACMPHTVTVGNIGGPRQSDSWWTPPSNYTDGPGFDANGLLTNYGAAIDICAVGLDTFLPALDETTGAQSWGFHGGTSFSAPLVAGICGLIWSVNPALTNQQVLDILYGTAGRPRQRYVQIKQMFGSPLTTIDWNEWYPNAGIADAHKAVLKAMTTVPANAGARYPYLSAWGTSGVYNSGAVHSYAGSAITTTLNGAVTIEVAGYSSDPITSVELWLGGTRLYFGPPTTLNATATSAGSPAALTVVATTASGSTTETYTDVVVDSLVLSADLTGDQSLNATNVLAFDARAYDSPVYLPRNLTLGARNGRLYGPAFADVLSTSTFGLSVANTFNATAGHVGYVLMSTGWNVTLDALQRDYGNVTLGAALAFACDAGTDDLAQSILAQVFSSQSDASYAPAGVTGSDITLASHLNMTLDAIQAEMGNVTLGTAFASRLEGEYDEPGTTGTRLYIVHGYHADAAYSFAFFGPIEGTLTPLEITATMIALESAADVATGEIAATVNPLYLEAAL